MKLRVRCPRRPGMNANSKLIIVSYHAGERLTPSATGIARPAPPDAQCEKMPRPTFKMTPSSSRQNPLASDELIRRGNALVRRGKQLQGSEQGTRLVAAGLMLIGRGRRIQHEGRWMLSDLTAILEAPDAQSHDETPIPDDELDIDEGHPFPAVEDEVVFDMRRDTPVDHAAHYASQATRLLGTLGLTCVVGGICCLAAPSRLSGPVAFVILLAGLGFAAAASLVHMKAH